MVLPFIYKYLYIALDLRREFADIIYRRENKASFRRKRMHRPLNFSPNRIFIPALYGQVTVNTAP